ncbi:MAG: response regulator [Planctomycetes bacterium]|nr:response regulator [Planctomycetota bacterium]
MTAKTHESGTFDAAALLEGLVDGVGVVDASGEIVWMSGRLAAQTPEVMRRFADTCRDILREAKPDRPNQLRRFRSGTKTFEVAISKMEVAGRSDHAVATLLNVTPRQRLFDRIEQVDNAGDLMLNLDAVIVNPLNVAERLKLLESRVEQSLRELFAASNYQVRLLDRKTRVLELVLHRGIAPLPIGQQMRADMEGAGITGYVASTGQSYLCKEPASDPRYRAGLPNCRCSLTSPLLLHDRVVGTINLESGDPRAFEEEDQFLLELYGRYVAMALNILDMLIVERYTTNQRIAGSVQEEIAIPVRSLRESLESLRGTIANSSAGMLALGQMEDCVASLEKRLQSATDGFKGILGVDRISVAGTTQPKLAGRRVLVVDDEAGIRDAIVSILSQHGAVVTAFERGEPALAALESAKKEDKPFELVLSDVRLPDRNGYEIFRATKAIDTETPVILMTGFGYDPNHSIVRSSQEGLHCFLFKPFQAQQLLDEACKAIVTPPHGL